MTSAKSYFFCGIGGSGMLPLALIVQGRGAAVAGSDRSLDQGMLAPKFDFLRRRGIALFPQDGSGLTSADQLLVTSAAVEETVPDVVKAKDLGAARVNRPELLAELFNAAGRGIAVAGTSGKSTVTGMIGWILHEAGRDPTVMNGAVMKNFVAADMPFASALVGSGADFVSEVDESDGSIALYQPAIAVLNNISLDHKSMDELRILFGAFLGRAGRAIVNMDDREARALAATVPTERVRGFGIDNHDADLVASRIVEAPYSVSCRIEDRLENKWVDLKIAVPGRHNVANALAAIGAAMAAGLSLEDAAGALAGFTGLRRRFDLVGEAGGIAVIDDFGHNPDKIAATLDTLHAFRRLLLFFQPHGFGPLRMMGRELAETFAGRMGAQDVLILCDPVYHGGTTDKSVGSETVVDAVVAKGRTAEHIPTREACGDRLVELARPDDRIIVMGARDDTLTVFAESLVARLTGR